MDDTGYQVALMRYDGGGICNGSLESEDTQDLCAL